MTYEGGYILAVFKTCDPRHGSRVHVADIVWCMENRVDEDVHDDHFPRLGSPGSVTEDATEPDDWDADDIRDTWIQNVG